MKTKNSSPITSVWTKGFLLVLLAVQNAALTLCTRMSRVSANVEGNEGYAKTTLVVVVEGTKIFVSFLLLMIDRKSGFRESWSYLYVSTFSHPGEVLKLLVPSSLYVLQNNLILVAADNLPGPVVAVLSQLKILTTALFSVVLLKKPLSSKQWLALVALLIGVASVQVSSMMTSNGSGSSSGSSTGENVVTGGLAALAAAMTSGFAGVYFEMVLKGSDMSVWVRNIHLAIFGVLVAGFGVLSQPTDMESVRSNGFFGGYDSLVWFLVSVQAFGGLLVAAVVKYTDNILKAFATSASLVGVSVISVLFFNFPAPPLFVFGTLLVLGAMFLYGDMLPSSILSTIESCLGVMTCDFSTKANSSRFNGEERIGANLSGLSSGSGSLQHKSFSGGNIDSQLKTDRGSSFDSTHDEESSPLIARRLSEA